MDDAGRDRRAITNAHGDRAPAKLDFTLASVTLHGSATGLHQSVVGPADQRSQIRGASRIPLEVSVYPTDEELLSDGSADGFAVLYGRRYPLVRGYLRRQVGPRSELVLDLVAETFARALERRDQFDPDRGSAVGWLLGIARNLLLDAMREGSVAQTARRRLGMERIVLESGQLELIERESASDLEHALSALPAHQREAIERRVLADEPYAAIAERIGCSEQVVRKRVSRGLTALRRASEESA